MDRREFNAVLMASSLAGLFVPSVRAEQSAPRPARPVIGIMIYPDMFASKPTSSSRAIVGRDRMSVQKPKHGTL